MPVVLAADIAMAVLGAVFAPTVAAITVGLVRPQYLAHGLARNAACDRAGNIFAAAAGIAGWASGRWHECQVGARAYSHRVKLDA